MPLVGTPRNLIAALRISNECWLFMNLMLIRKKVNLIHFMPLVLFYTPLKTLEGLCFSDIFRGYRKWPVTWNGLRTVITFVSPWKLVPASIYQFKVKALVLFCCLYCYFCTDSTNWSGISMIDFEQLNTGLIILRVREVLENVYCKGLVFNWRRLKHGWKQRPLVTLWRFILLIMYNCTPVSTHLFKVNNKAFKYNDHVHSLEWLVVYVDTKFTE